MTSVETTNDSTLLGFKNRSACIGLSVDTDNSEIFRWVRDTHSHITNTHTYSHIYALFVRNTLCGEEAVIAFAKRPIARCSPVDQWTRGRGCGNENAGMLALRHLIPGTRLDMCCWCGGLGLKVMNEIYRRMCWRDAHLWITVYVCVCVDCARELSYFIGSVKTIIECLSSGVAERQRCVRVGAWALRIVGTAKRRHSIAFSTSPIRVCLSVHVIKQLNIRIIE